MTRNHGKGRSVGALALALLLLLGACGGSGGDGDETYKIGMSIDLSGPISFNGKIAAAGFQAGVEQLNEDGGVNGRKIDLTVIDDASDVAKGRANIQQFSDEGALAVFGFILSNISNAAIPLATDLKIPLVGLGGPATSFEPVQQYYYSYELRADRLGIAILQRIAEVAEADGIEIPRIAVFTVDTPSNRDMASMTEAAIAERGWEMVALEYMPVAPTDVTAQASTIRDADPDYVLMSHNDAGALVAVRGLRSQGVEVPVFNQWAGSADATFEQLGSNYSAFRTYVSPTETDNPAVGAMREKAAALGYEESMTNPYFTQGWVAAQVILKQALEKCGDCTSGEAFAAALESLGDIDTNGLSGPLSLSADSHEMVSTVRFYEWDESAGAPKAVSGWVSAR